MKYFLFSLMAFFFVGCTTTTSPKVEYRISSELKNKELKSSNCKEKSLQVSQAFSSNLLMSQGMSYVMDNTKQYLYSKSQWSVTPNKAITAEFLTMLRESELFKSVQVSKSRAKSDFILEINIEDFMQYFSKDSSDSYVNVIIGLTIIDSKTNTIYASKTFKAKVDAKSLDAEGGVIALNEALSIVMFKSAEWFSEVCR